MLIQNVRIDCYGLAHEPTVCENVGDCMSHFVFGEASKKCFISLVSRFPIDLLHAYKRCSPNLGATD